MKKNSKIIIFKILFFIFIVISLIFINTFAKDSSKINLPLTTKEVSQENISIEHLENTCPRGRTCTRPLCSLWSDLNNDGICDRGKK
jgi:hypothetical protein